MTKQNICEKCLHFVQHYIQNGARFVRAGWGQCRDKKSKVVHFLDECENWRSYTEKMEAKKQSIFCAIETIAQKISAIEQILQEIGEASLPPSII